ncbi:MAG: hypothetical protein AAGM22_28510, partial [Acidobacteriota bacterium]
QRATVFLTLLLCLFVPSAMATEKAAPKQTPVSATVLEFGGVDTLFVADSDGGKIFAYTLPKNANTQAPTDSKPFNLTGFSNRIAESLKVDPRRLRYNDLAVHPVTKDAYVSVSIRGGAQGKGAAVVKVNQAGDIQQLDLGQLEHTSFPLAQAADGKVTFWRDLPASTFSVTDLDFVDGQLYVSGLSTGEFSSTLRKIPYPFDGKASASSVEMYHAAHNQNETRAPIRAMAVVDLDGKKTVVAAYTCTPLVTIPVAALEDGKHVVGKTVGELGYGNTPLEVVSYRAYNMKMEAEEFVLVINREMAADLIKLEDLASAAKAQGLAKPVELGDSSGVATTPIPLSGVLQAADQDAQFLLTLKRNLDTGDMDLVSYRKGAYMRISDFVSEYNFPDYQYEEGGEGAKQFQNLLKMDEGFPERVR